MGLSDTAELVARLSLKGDFTSKIKGADKALGKFESKLGKVTGRTVDWGRAGQQVGTGIRNAASIAAVGIVALGTQVAVGVKSLARLETIGAQTEAVIKSTGGAAGVTAVQVRAQADEIERLTGIESEAIQEGQNLLLTFTNIGQEVFPDATEAINDMSVALGQDMSSSAIQLGKALNDPIRGITALRRVGVQFTKGQEKQIKALVETGDVLGAQKLILKEINKEFGGSAAAFGNTGAGKVAKLGHAFGTLQEALATGMLPVISRVADKLNEALADPKVLKTAEDIGNAIAGLFTDANLKTGADVLNGLFNTARDVAPAIAAAAKVTGQVVKTAVALFSSLPKELQTLLVGGLAVNKLTGGLVTNLAGGLIGSVLKQLVSGVVNVQGAVVNVVGAPGGGIPPIAPAVGAAAGGLTAGAALTTGAVAVTLAGGSALSLQNIAEFAGKNYLLQQQGLTRNEISAQRFYNGSHADQQQMIKHLGRQPTKADFESGNRKLAAAITNPPTKPGTPGTNDRKGYITAEVGQQLVNANVRVGDRIAVGNQKTFSGIGTLRTSMESVKAQGATDAQYIAAAQARAALEAKIAAMTGAAQTSSASRIAGITSAGAARGAGYQVAGAMQRAANQISATVRASRPIISSTTVQRTTTVNNRYGSPSSDRHV